MPEPAADAGDTSPEVSAGGPAAPSEPAVEYIIVEPQNDAYSETVPEPRDTAPGATPPPLASADLDYQITPAAAVGATAPEPPRANDAPTSTEENAKSLDPRSLVESIPDQEPATARETNAVIRGTAVWLGRALAILGPAFSSDPRVRLVFAALSASRWIAKSLPEIISYLDRPKTLLELQHATRFRRVGYETHHIVERLRGSSHPLANSKVFRDRIGSPENLVSIPRWKHVEISAWYSRPNPRFGDLTPREFLREKSWKVQYETGIAILRDFGILQ